MLPDYFFIIGEAIEGSQSSFSKILIFLALVPDFHSRSYTRPIQIVPNSISDQLQFLFLTIADLIYTDASQIISRSLLDPHRSPFHLTYI